MFYKGIRIATVLGHDFALAKLRAPNHSKGYGSPQGERPGEPFPPNSA